MNLAVDIGNTRTKFALLQNGVDLTVEVIPADLTMEIIQKIKDQKITQGIISSVQHASKTTVWKDTFPQINWIELSHKTPVPFKSQYKTPQTLGLDRIALAAAAVNQYEGNNALIIDAGTCVTYDLVTSEKMYLGGAISPGLQMRLKAMHHFTARLPEVKIRNNVNLIGENTDECLLSGALNGLAAEIDGIINRYQMQFQDLQVVLTGGDMKILASLLKNNIFARPNFLLEGLHVILASNTH